MKKYFFLLILKLFQADFNSASLINNNKQQKPIKIKNNKNINDTPIEFQHKLEIPISLNYPFNLILSFSYSLNLILFEVKNSFSVADSFCN